MKVRRAAQAPMSERDAFRARMKQHAAAAEAFSMFRPAGEVLTRVRAVPTIFPQFDHATKVGGLPIERFSLLHGPSGGGKTYWTIGLLLSFLQRSHFAVLIDAERTTPITWLENAMGEYANDPYFLASRPTTYEAVVKNVRDFLNTLRRQRDAKKLPEDTSALIVVDSIRKLVPKNEWDRIMKDAKRGKESDEKVKDRGAQIKAAMNAAWMDQMIPILEETGSAMVVIARETEDPDAPVKRGFGGRPAPKAVKVGGGVALYYDASMNMRSSRIKSYGKKVGDGDQERLVAYGDVHRLDITKSKVAGKGEEYKASCEYHISNGVWVPAGFDRARDILTLARRFDVVEGTTWLKFGSWKRQGEDAAVKALHENPGLLAEIEAECRKHSATKQERTRNDLS